MKELTFGELKQGLTHCTIYKDCSGCPLYHGPNLGPEEDCTYKLMSAVMNCINVMEKDLEAANKRADDWESACEYLETRIHALHEAQDRRGKWTYYSSTMMECSICGKHVARHKFKFCPQCGHLMQEGIANE